MLSVRIKKTLDSTSGDERTRRPTPNEREGFQLDVNFEAPPGFTILFGASGSGKTTTLKAISGLVKPDEGRIAIDDEVLFDSDRRINIAIRNRGVGYVFQDLALFPHLTAIQNVEFGINHSPAIERRSKAKQLMESFKISHIQDRKPRGISGGEAQRVALARALANDPRMLLLDEPLSAIDEATKNGIIADLKTLNRELRLPILYVTHSREEAVSLGERVIVYEHGHIAATGEPLSVFGAPLTLSVARLTGVENIFDGRVIRKSDAAGTMTVTIADESGTCAIEVPFGNHGAGDNVTVAIPAGDVLLATVEPKFTSLRNRLPGKVIGIEDQANRTLVTVVAGVKWKASVTRQAINELELSNGSEVWLGFKTHSCYLLDRER